jgi:hypothetical protein
MIRDEVVQLGEALSKMGEAFADGDKEGVGEWVDIAFNIVKEGADLAKVPQEERLKGVLLAFTMAGSRVADKAIKFSDEA